MRHQQTTVLSLLSIFFLCFSFTLILKGCGTKTPEARVYFVAYDRTWSPLEIDSAGPRIEAFCEDLLSEVALRSDQRFQTVATTGEQVRLQLRSAEFQAMLTGIPTSRQNRTSYLFSEPFLYLGPVFLARSDSSVSAEDLGKSRVGIAADRPSDLEFVSGDLITIRTVEDTKAGVEQLIASDIDVLVITAVQARAYESGLYQGQVKVISGPLTQEHSLHFAVQRRQSFEHLTELFNRALLDIKEDGTYSKLIDKWELY